VTVTVNPAMLSGFRHAQPQHDVAVTRGYWLGRYELTQGQWEAVIPTRRPWWVQSNVQRNPSHPAVGISWDDVQDLVTALNQWEGKVTYRLPTEAEWEYACRAGTTTQWSFGDDEAQLQEYAWCADNAWAVGQRYAHAVGTKLPNPWGLYDMHGNVQEWVQDWFGFYSSGAQVDPQGPATGGIRVTRGGSFITCAGYSRSASRIAELQDTRFFDLGVRLARTE
jgi:formylglycine-generating enzyme required for sulfatase activity